MSYGPAKVGNVAQIAWFATCPSYRKSGQITGKQLAKKNIVKVGTGQQDHLGWEK